MFLKVLLLFGLLFSKSCWTLTCAEATRQANYWGVEIDDSLDWQPVLGAPHVDDPYEPTIRHAATNLLPTRVEELLGTIDQSSPIEAALRFHAEYDRSMGDPLSWVRSRYVTLGQGSKVAKGDLMLFWIPADSTRLMFQYAAIYLGGDFVYEKRSIEHRHRLGHLSSTLRAMDGISRARAGRHTIVEFLHYDPMHRLAPQTPPLGDEGFGLPLQQRYMLEYHPNLFSFLPHPAIHVDAPSRETSPPRL